MHTCEGAVRERNEKEGSAANPFNDAVRQTVANKEERLGGNSLSARRTERHHYHHPLLSSDTPAACP